MAWAPDYTTPEDLANFVRIGDTADDVQLGLAIAVASRTIDGPTGCNRQFGKLDTAAARSGGSSASTTSCRRQTSPSPWPPTTTATTTRTT
jgi:hypothetical protein